LRDKGNSKNIQTYGIKAYNDTVYEAALEAYSRPGGCKDQIIKCQKLMAELDPDALGNNEKVNSYCGTAMQFCEDTMVTPYINLTTVSLTSTQSTLFALTVGHSMDGMI
jgi:hypothetical protein